MEARRVLQVTEKDRVVRSCPFCGGREIEIFNSHTAYYSVRCLGCECEISSPRSFEKKWRSIESKILDHLKAIRSAVRAWNRRPCSCALDDLATAYLDASVLWGEHADDRGCHIVSEAPRHERA